MAFLDLTDTWQEIGLVGVAAIALSGDGAVQIAVATSAPTGDIEDAFPVADTEVQIFPKPTSGSLFVRVSFGTARLKYYEI